MNKTPMNKMMWCVVFLLCFSWWGYLFSSANMQISADAIGYEQMGLIIKEQGWAEYFRGGPRREPLYPLLISISVRLGDTFHCSYQTVQKCFQFAILFLSQLLMLAVLRKLNVRDGICALAVFYFGVSPAMTNSALSLYSEILVYPWILLIVLCFSSLADGFPRKHLKQVVIFAVVLAVLFLATTLIKGIFEFITLLVLGFAGLIAVVNLLRKNAGVVFKTVIFLLVFAAVYFVPLHFYKLQNKKYNDTYTLTDRGNWILYASIARRLEPLTPERFWTGLAFVPGEGLCDRLFGKEACYFWTYKTVDKYGFDKYAEFNALKLSNDEMNHRFMKIAFQDLMNKPVQVIFLTFLEGLKMFFWESTKIGYVQYPPWLESLHSTALLKDVLRGVTALLTVFSFIFGFWFLWNKRKELCVYEGRQVMVIFFVLAIATAFVSLYALFFVATRYAFPIVSLYLILIAFTADRIISNKR